MQKLGLQISAACIAVIDLYQSAGIHSHLLWLGLLADAFGVESLFMQFWKIRERIMDINEATAGNRVLISTNIVGGVRKDLSR